MHHCHIALVVLQLLSLYEVKNTKQQDALERVYHDYVDHVYYFLVDSNLILKSVVLNKGAVGGGVVVWLDIKVAPNTVLLNYLGSVYLLFNVELFPSNHVLEVLLF